jgi:hypothetical protein
MRLKEAHGMIVKHDPEDHNGCRYFPPKLTIINPRNGKKVVDQFVPYLTHVSLGYHGRR